MFQQEVQPLLYWVAPDGTRHNIALPTNRADIPPDATGMAERPVITEKKHYFVIIYYPATGSAVARIDRVVDAFKPLEQGGCEATSSRWHGCCKMTGDLETLLTESEETLATLWFDPEVVGTTAARKPMQIVNRYEEKYETGHCFVFQTTASFEVY